MSKAREQGQRFPFSGRFLKQNNYLRRFKVVRPVAMMVIVKVRLWAVGLPQGQHLELLVLWEPGMPGREQNR